MKQIFGIKYGIVNDLKFIDKREFTVFPLINSGGVIGYYFESKVNRNLNFETRIKIEPMISKGRIKDIDLRVYLVSSDNHQKVLEIDKSHDKAIINEDGNGNLVLHYSQEVLPPKRVENITIEQVINVTQFKIDDFSEIKLVKSGNNKKFKPKSGILELAEKLKMGDDLNTIINCVKFIKSNVKYVRNYFRLGALFALKHGKGACDEITDLCASLLEAMGYDIRVIIGYVLDGGFHAWLEAKSKKHGWIPIDATFGLIGGIGVRWIRLYAENNPNEKIIKYSSSPRKVRISLDYFLEGEKLS